MPDEGPWNLIYVFDGDPDTKVVCEGFAKAFQYLCDLTDFSDPNLWVYCVTGYMDGGAHMWNIVHLRQGNFMADITNCVTNGSTQESLFFSLPMSGDVDQGYVFMRTEAGYLPQEIKYIYYDATRELFTEEELTLYNGSLPSVECALTLELGDRVSIWNASYELAAYLGTGIVENAEVDDDRIVAVQEEGVLSALAVGQTTIDIGVSDCVYSLKVTVKEKGGVMKLPQGLTTVDGEAFRNTICNRLIVPSAMDAVDAEAFAGMNDLTHIVIESDLPENVLLALPHGEDILWLCCEEDTVNWADSHGYPALLYVK